MSRKLVTAAVCMALMTTGMIQAGTAAAEVPSPTSSSEPQPSSQPTADPDQPAPVAPSDSPPADPAPVDPAPVDPTPVDPTPVDPGGFTPADPTVTPDSSTPELDAQVKAQEKLQSQVPAHKSLSPLVSPLAANGFDPGYIISDELFYDGNATDAASVQNFLNAMLPSCRSGYTCLKDYAVPTTSRPSSAMCNAYNGGGVETAATIIYKVGVACGISQKALLVLLQKEQSLITDDWPSARQYAAATGYACPDTADCDANYAGFYNQVYWAAYQFKRYGNPPGTSNYFTWYPVGGNSSIRYSPNAACGSSNVVVRNKATAALYYYTPYQPNQAAINGSPDTCSAFGNLNFFVLYTNWFGSPNGAPAIAPIGAFERAVTASGALTISGWAADASSFSSSNRVRIDVYRPDGSVTGTTVDAANPRPELNVAVPGLGVNHGFSWSTPISDSGTYTSCVRSLPLPGNPAEGATLGCSASFYSNSIQATPSSTRLGGANRYDAAVSISKAAFPTGTKAPVVYVVTGDDYPDALSAGPAAAKQGGPLLLTPTDAVTTATRSEIQRLAPAKIVVVGGPNSVSENVFAELSTLVPGGTTVRISGADRYEVSRAVASTVFAPSSTGAFIATGTNYPDALSAGAVAGGKGQPVILVNGPSSTVDTATRSTLTGLGVTAMTVVGGPNSVSPAVFSALEKIAPTTRFSGEDRIAATVALNAASFGSASEIFFATSQNFPDALAGTALAAKKKLPLYVVQPTCVPASVLAEVVRLKASKVTILGGTATLSVEVGRLKRC